MKETIFIAVFILSAATITAQTKKTETKLEEKEVIIIGTPYGEDPGPVEIGEVVDNKIYSGAGLQVQPEFPGGGAALIQEILKNTNFKDNGIERKLEVKVYVTFVVEKDGLMSNVKVSRDPGYGLGKEVEAAAKKVKKKWSPGIVNGKPVRVQYAVPVPIEVN